MRSYFRRATATAGLVLSAMAVTDASAHPASQNRRTVPVSAAAPTSRSVASAGTQLWATRYNGTGNNADAATALAVSPTGGTVYVTGWSYGTALIRNYATIAYSAVTGARQWVSRYTGAPGNLDSLPSAVAVSPDGKSVFVTGKSLSPSQDQND